MTSGEAMQEYGLLIRRTKMRQSLIFHAQDLWRSGATLAEILTAGQWKSAAFLRYLDEAELEKVRLRFPCAIAHVLQCFAGDGLPGSHRVRPRRR